MEFRGTLYRSISPKYARTPLSGAGASTYGGRFNAKGVPALYTAMDLMTCLYEANQTGGINPSTIVSFDAHFANLVDALTLPLTDQLILEDPDWRQEMHDHGVSRTQMLAQRLIDEGYHGMVVPSYEPRAMATGGKNLVIWTWGSDLPHKITLIDPENRLIF